MRKSREPSAGTKLPMYMCIVEAVACDAKDFRPGARHTIVIILAAASTADAGSDAQAFVEQAGWIHVEIDLVEELDVQSDLMQIDTLNEAVGIARLRGHCLAVDVQEIPLDS